MKAQPSAELTALLECQHGVVARWQAVSVGLDPQLIDIRLRRGRWQRMYTGVYATFTGPPPRPAVLWAALLRAGPGAVLSHQTAAELDLLIDHPSAAIHVTVGRSRNVTIAEQRQQLPPILVHYSGRDAGHPARTPRRTRIEDTALDLAHTACDVDDATAWLYRACGRRLTTPRLLRDAMAGRARLRWRAELTEALEEAGDGVQSLLESRYLRRVERPHGLPQPRRQARNRVSGRTRYLDDLYQEYGVAVELDGQAAHPAEARWRDIRRDNASASAGIVTLRYGWADITDDPCRVAAEVAAALKVRGWPGQPRTCGPRCRMPAVSAEDPQA